MTDIRALQKRVYQNKIDKGFNVTDVYMEFCYMYGELNEAVEAYAKKKEDLGEELADIALYLLGLAEILGVDLEHELILKANKNEKRRYTNENGVLKRIED